MKYLLIAVTLFACMRTDYSVAQNGTIDPTFNENDIDYGFGEGFGASVKSFVELANGQLLFGGEFNIYEGDTVKGVIRTNSDGSLDETLSTDGNWFACSTSKILVQPDGKLILIGSIYPVSGPIQYICRLLPDGTIDNSFTPGTGTNDVIQDAELLPDGRILIVGAFTQYNGVARNRIAQLTTNGSLDVSFNPGTAFNNTVTCVEIQSNGKILAGGNFTSYYGTNINRLVRINTDGTFDNTFNIGTGLNNVVRDIDVLTDQSVIVSGHFTTVNGLIKNRLVKFTSTGSIDATFDIGSGFDNNVNSVKITADNKLLVGGDFLLYNGLDHLKLVRLNTDGIIDNTFTLDSRVVADINLVNTLNNGNIAIGGEFWFDNGSPYGAFTTLDETGAIVYSFPIGNGANNNINVILPIGPDRFLLIGTFTTYNGELADNIVKIDFNGNIDHTFDSWPGTDTEIIKAVVQPDGKILICGNFTTVGSYNRSHIARINPDGSLDLTFDPGTGADDAVVDLGITTDGKVVIVGNFQNYNGVARDQMALLNSNGSLDLTFNPGTSTNDFISTVVVEQNGTFLIGGGFEYYNSGVCTGIARVNPDGSFNSSLNIGSGITQLNYVSSIAIQTDNKIVVVGGFYGPNNTLGIARFNPDGSADNSFNAGLGSNAVITNVRIAPDNTMFIFGGFTEFDGQLALRIAKLRPNGEMDPNMIVNNSTHYTDIFIHDDFLMVSGLFLSLNGTTRRRIAKLENCVTTIPTAVQSGFTLPSDPNNCVGQFAVDISGNGDFELDIDNGSQTATSSGYSLFTGLCAGVHDLQIINSCGDTTVSQFVIPVDSNYVFNNPFIDSLAQDSLGVTVEDCEIYYAGIDTAYIDSIWANGNTVNVIWNIVDSNGSNLDTTTYELNNGNGVYWLQLSVFCPTKALGDYFTVTEAIYFEDGDISTAGINDWENLSIQIYPNPTNDFVTISFKGNQAELTIYDAQGKLIKQAQEIYSGSLVSLKDVLTGVYFFELKTLDGKAVKRVAKN